MSELTQRVIATICKVGGLPPIEAGADFYDAGFSSVRSLELLMELESEYGVSVPDDQFIAARTPNDIAAMVQRLSEEAA